MIFQTTHFRLYNITSFDKCLLIIRWNAIEKCENEKTNSAESYLGNQFEETLNGVEKLDEQIVYKSRKVQQVIFYAEFKFLNLKTKK
ncbi:hypothetical protein BpHYR1_049690 [Brachionus plicatilis]|uniref:Uncharacterized protein n=1 Tax=Brachionus plicatilis TaxID=10195 RepID=A0A3M7R8Q0_BRAPC|nr:hypothetical protein BpHYR1_049690 [Brachionus plicatilis]